MSKSDRTNYTLKKIVSKYAKQMYIDDPKIEKAYYDQ
jgi:hypothetical protein